MNINHYYTTKTTKKNQNTKKKYPPKKLTPREKLDLMGGTFLDKVNSMRDMDYDQLTALRDHPLFSKHFQSKKYEIGGYISMAKKTGKTYNDQIKDRGLNEDRFLNNLPEPLRLEVMKELTKELLKEVPMFRYCSNQLKNILILALRAETFSPGSFISRAGDKGNEILFISKGVLQVVNEESGDIYCDFGPGEYFGNLSIMLQENRSASVRTKTFSETFILDSNAFYSIKTDFPEFLDVLKKMSAEKSEKTNQLLMDGIII